MKHSLVVLAICLMASTAQAGNIFEHALDGSDMTGISGYWHPATGDFDGDTVADGYVTMSELSDWYALSIDVVALTGGPIDVTNGLTIEWDARYWQDETNTNRWADAPMGVQLHSVQLDDPEADYRAKWEWPFGPQGDAEQFPEWKHCVADFDDMAADPWFWSDGEWEPTNVIEIVLYGTDWYSADPSDDYIQVKNLVITPEPASLALLALGGIALIRRR